MKRFDVAVIGGGPGGYVAALRAAHHGASVALVEKAELGGTCLNRGCIPTKALLESARVFRLVREAEAFGVTCENPGFDLGKICRRKDAVVRGLGDGIAALLKKRGVAVLKGRGTLLARDRLRVAGADNEEVAAAKVILATGTVSARPGAFPFDDDRVADSDHFLTLDKLPESVAIVGGGYIGCEFASALSTLGCRVTVVEALPRLLPGADEAVSAELSRAFRRAGVMLQVGKQVEGMAIDGEGGGVRVRLSGGRELCVEKVLVAVGRSPCSANLGLEAAGVSTTDRGFIPVNQHCQTSVPSVYAIGDIAGGAQLAHLASRMGLVAAAHATGHRGDELDLKVLPSCVFTRPEVASVGLTEAQAREAGHPVKAARFPYRALGKAWATGETDGFFKLVAHSESGEVLGVHIVGARASDLIGEAALALRLECTVEEVAQTIHAHPTLHEGLLECAESWLGMGVHG